LDTRFGHRFPHEKARRAGGHPAAGPRLQPEALLIYAAALNKQHGANRAILRLEQLAQRSRAFGVRRLRCGELARQVVARRVGSRGQPARVGEWTGKSSQRIGFRNYSIAGLFSPKSWPQLFKAHLTTGLIVPHRTQDGAIASSNDRAR